MASRKVLPIDGALTFVVVVVFLVPSVLTAFKDEVFMKRCLGFKETQANCEKAWVPFEKAYVGKDPNQVTPKDYEKLFTEVPFKHPCHKTLLYSKTRNVTYEFAKRGECFIPIARTLLGYVLDGLIWCGKKNSLETFTYDKCVETEINPYISFWTTASIRYAQHACGVVIVLLNGDLPDPYDPESFLVRDEIPYLEHPKVTKLIVIMSVKAKGTQCNNVSLKNLQNVLKGKNIGYVCKEVLKSELEKCEHAKSADGVCQCQELFKTLLYSNTKDVIHKLVVKKEWYTHIWDTMLGHVVEGFTWCGKKNVAGTFTDSDCNGNEVPRNSYFEMASIKFAQHACETVTVLLNGDADVPYDPDSYFAKYEVPELKHPPVDKLHVILAVKTKGKECKDPSVKDLENIIKGKGIAYVCEEVPISDLGKVKSQ